MPIGMLSFAFAGLPEILLTRMVDDAGRKRLGFALGNALSANTVERLLCRVLYIANLVQSPLSDFWAKIVLDRSKDEARFARCSSSCSCSSSQ